MTLKDRALNYFRVFSDKNLEGLAGLFADPVSLRDWDVAASGKESVLRVNRKIFEGVDTIQGCSKRGTWDWSGKWWSVNTIGS